MKSMECHKTAHSGITEPVTTAIISSASNNLKKKDEQSQIEEEWNNSAQRMRNLCESFQNESNYVEFAKDGRASRNEALLG
jgi:hypothetical protein